MVATIFATITASLLGFYAFWGGAVTGDHLLNPFGIMFLLLAGFIWFAWGPIREAFKSAKDQSDLPILRLGSSTIKGMKNMKRDGYEHRRSPS